jgi:hypothetical protein
MEISPKFDERVTSATGDFAAGFHITKAQYEASSLLACGFNQKKPDCGRSEPLLSFRNRNQPEARGCKEGAQ